MPRVLVISPTDLAAGLRRTVLWREGIDRSFADGPAGYEAARSWAPNLVVLDSADADAAATMARRLREDPATRGTAIAAVSHDPFLADAEALRKAGANVVIPSDADPQVWDARLEELLTVPPRRDAQVPVRGETWSGAPGQGERVEGSALNISVNGLLLESASSLHPGLKLDLLFRIPGRDEDLRAVGEVVRRHDRTRWGIRFLVLRGRAREAIRAFAEQAAAPAAGTAARAGQDPAEHEWEAALRASEALRSAILESSLDSIILLNQEGGIVDVNPAAERAFGYSREQLVGRRIGETIAPPSGDQAQRRELMRGLAEGSGRLMGRRLEMTATRADGTGIPVELTISSAPVAGRRLYMGFLRDVSAAKRAERLQAAARRITDASAVADGLADLGKAIHMFVAELMYAKHFAIALGDASGTLSFPYSADEEADRNTAVAAERKALAEHVLATGTPLAVPSPAFMDLVTRGLLPAPSQASLEWLVVPLRKHGQSLGVVVLRSDDPAVHLMDDEETLRILGQAIGVALDRKQAELHIHYLAFHDPLTGLPNRHLMLDRLDLGIAHATRDRNHLGVLLVDLDRFKVINDSLGHTIGDQVIKEAAGRLARPVRKGDTLARVGGDKFAVVIRGLRDPADVAKVAQTLQGSLAEPLHIADRELFVTACVGISIFPEDGADVETLLKNADTALHRAKEQGHDSFRLYDASMNAEAVQRLKLEHGLRRALSRDELVTYYQPVVDLATGEIQCVEALLRWRHPERGLLLPAEFIGLAETTGMIRSIGTWALRAACAQARAWQEQGHARLSVAVNLSARELHQMNIVPEVTSALRDARLDPGFLELEITESSAMVNAAATIRALEALKALGVRISIDDFGIGYSSMSQLQRLPIDVLKIDQSFVRDITTDPDDAAIVTAIITLGHTLKLRVVAEGVETPEQLAFLAAQGCDRIQGYVFAHPAPAEQCRALLDAHQADRWRRRRT